MTWNLCGWVKKEEKTRGVSKCNMCDWTGRIGNLRNLAWLNKSLLLVATGLMDVPGMGHLTEDTYQTINEATIIPCYDR